MGVRKPGDPIDPTHADLIGCFAALRRKLADGNPPNIGDAFTCDGCGRRFVYEKSKVPGALATWRAQRAS